MWEKDPTRIISEAVAGMLPKNKLRPYRMDKLKIFSGTDHPFTEFPLVPFVPKPRTINIAGVGWPMPEGLQPMNPDRYGFRLRASPALAKLQEQGSAQAAGSSSDATSGPRSAQVAAGAQSGAGLSGFEDLLTAEEKAAVAAEFAKDQAGAGLAGRKGPAGGSQGEKQGAGRKSG